MKRIPKGRRGGNGHRTQAHAPQNPAAATNHHAVRLIKGQQRRGTGSMGRPVLVQRRGRR